METCLNGNWYPQNLEDESNTFIVHLKWQHVSYAFFFVMFTPSAKSLELQHKLFLKLIQEVIEWIISVTWSSIISLKLNIPQLTCFKNGTRDAQFGKKCCSEIEQLKRYGTVILLKNIFFFSKISSVAKISVFFKFFC